MLTAPHAKDHQLLHGHLHGQRRSCPASLSYSTFKADRIPAEAEEDCSLKIRSEGCGDSLYYVRKHALS